MSLKIPHPLDKDLSPPMKEAMRVLDSKKIRFARVTEHQLKVGPLNYYPTKGTITLDGGPVVSARGIDAFLRLAEAVQDGSDPRKVAAAPGWNKTESLDLQALAKTREVGA